MYDLSCSPEISVVKKKVIPIYLLFAPIYLPFNPHDRIFGQVLQQFAAVYHMDDPVLHWRSFRLN